MNNQIRSTLACLILLVSALTAGLAVAQVDPNARCGNGAMGASVSSSCTAYPDGTAPDGFIAHITFPSSGPSSDTSPILVVGSQDVTFTVAAQLFDGNAYGPFTGSGSLFIQVDCDSLQSESPAPLPCSVDGSLTASQPLGFDATGKATATFTSSQLTSLFGLPGGATSTFVHLFVVPATATPQQSSYAIPVGSVYAQDVAVVQGSGPAAADLLEASTPFTPVLLTSVPVSGDGFVAHFGLPVTAPADTTPANGLPAIKLGTGSVTFTIDHAQTLQGSATAPVATPYNGTATLYVQVDCDAVQSQPAVNGALPCSVNDATLTVSAPLDFSAVPGTASVSFKPRDLRPVFLASPASAPVSFVHLFVELPDGRVSSYSLPADAIAAQAPAASAADAIETGFTPIALVLTDTTAPTAPTLNTVVGQSPSRIDLTWTPATDMDNTMSANSGKVDTYELYRATATGVPVDPAHLVGTFPSTATTASDTTGLVAGTTYFYKLRAVDSSGNVGAASAEKSAPAADQVAPDLAPVLQAPVSPVATVDQLDLNWSAAHDNVGIDHYQLLRGASATSLAPVSGSCSSLGDVLACNDTGLVTGQSYFYAVRGLDAAGNPSARSNVLHATPIDQQAPTQVTGVTAQVPVSSLTEIDLAWSPAVDNSGTVAAYLVHRGTASGFTPDASNLVASTPSTSYSDGNLTAGTYYYVITAVDPSGNQAVPSLEATNAPGDYTPPSAVAQIGVASPPNNATLLAVHWTPATDNSGAIDHYIVSRGTSSGSLSPIGAYGCANVGSALSCVDGALATGTTYYYAVSAVDAAGNVGPSSPVANGTPIDQTPPTQVTGLTVVQDPSSVTDLLLSWSPATDAVGVDHYEVLRGTTAGAGALVPGGACSGLGSVLTCTDAGLVEGTPYYYTVRAVDAAGNLGAASSEVQASPGDSVAPDAVTGVVAGTQEPVEGSVTFAWDAAHDNIGVDHYEVAQILFNGNGAVLRGPILATGYTESGLLPGSIVTYRVAAVDAAGNQGPFSDPIVLKVPDLTPPDAVQGLTVASPMSSLTSLSISWSPAVDNSQHIESYQLFRGTTGELAPIDTGACASLDGTTLSCVDEGLTTGTPYVYAVRALDAAGNIGAFSTSVTGIPLDRLAPQFTALTAIASSSTQVDLAWDATDNSGAIDHYQVLRSDTLVPADASPLTTGGCSGANLTTATSCNDTTVAPGASYLYMVVATDPSGNTANSTITVKVPDLPDTTAPDAVTGLVATAASPTQITLGWTAAQDDRGVSHYEVFRGSSSTTMALLATGGCSSLAAVITCSDSGLTPATTYVYKVRAIDAAGNVGAFSATATRQTPVQPDTTKPSAVVVTVTASSPVMADLTWTASTDDSGQAPHYDVFRGATATFTPNDASRVATGVTVLAFHDGGRTPGTTYFYVVRAVDAAGNLGDLSAAKSVTMPLDTTAPAAVAGLAATALSRTAIDLTWTAATDNVAVAHYQVYRSTVSAFTPSSATLVASPTAAVFHDTGLAAGTAYFYKVRAVDAAGNAGAFSAQATASTQAPLVLAPSDVVQSVTTALVPGGIRVQWTMAHPTANVTSFLIGRHSDFTVIATVSPTAGSLSYSYVDTEFPGGNHTYTVQARYGNSTSTTFAANAPSSPLVSYDVCVVRPTDTDQDGLCDAREVQLGTDPAKADTDGDGVSDATEFKEGSNPLDAKSMASSHLVVAPGFKALQEPWIYLGILLLAAILALFGVAVYRTVRQPTPA